MSDTGAALWMIAAALFLLGEGFESKRDMPPRPIRYIAGALFFICVGVALATWAAPCSRTPEPEYTHVAAPDPQTCLLHLCPQGSDHPMVRFDNGDCVCLKAPR